MKRTFWIFWLADTTNPLLSICRHNNNFGLSDCICHKFETHFLKFENVFVTNLRKYICWADLKFDRKN